MNFKSWRNVNLLIIYKNISIRLLSCLLLSIIIIHTAKGQNCSVNSGINDTICANEAMILHGSKAGLFQGSGITTWSQIGGPSCIITNPENLVTTVTGFTGGNTYQFRISSTCQDGTLVYNDVSIVVKSAAIATAGTPETYCPGTYSLAGNAPGIGQSGLWTIVGNNYGITINSPESSTSTITLSENSAGATTLRWTLTSTNGCSSYSDVVIKNRGGVSPVSAGTNQNISHCFTTTTSCNLSGSYGGNGTGGQSGLWSVVTGPNTPDITNPSSNTTSVTNLISGTYIFRWTVSGPCLSGSSTVNVTIPSPVGSNSAANVTQGSQTFCDSRVEAVLIGDNPTYANEVVTWTKLSGAGTIISPNNTQTTVTGLNPPASSTFEYNITNSVTACSSTSGVVTLSYSTLDPPSISITSSTNVILPVNDTSTTVTYTFEGGTNTSYAIVETPSGTVSNPSWINSESPQLVAVPNVEGQYVIRFRRYTNGGIGGCGEADADMNIFISQTPTASNAGTAQDLACNVFSTALAGNIPSVGTGVWYQVSGPNNAVISNPNFNDSPISNLIPGKYVFRWSITAGANGTTSEDDVNVIVSPPTPTTSAAGNSTTVCYATTTILQGNSPAINETGTWSVTPGEGVIFSDIHTPHAIVKGLIANTVYTFQWKIANACGADSSTVVITTSGIQGPVQANAGPDQCQSASTTVITQSGNNPESGTGIWSQISGPACSITDVNSPATTVTGMSKGNYLFQWEINWNGCSSTVDTVMVTISQPATTSLAGSEQQICGTSTTLSGNAVSVGVGSWSQISGPGLATISDTLSSTPTISNLVTGVYTFKWNVTNYACPSNYSYVNLYVSSPPTTANAGPNQNICPPATTADLAANAITVGSGTWSYISGPNYPAISNITSPAAVLSNLIYGTYQMLWTSQNGPYCPSSSDTVVINFTPAANAGSNQNLCNETTTYLTGNSEATGIWTQISGPSCTITSTGINTAVVTGMTPGSYDFRFTISNGCSSSYADITVVNSAVPSVPDAGTDQQLCNAALFNMNGNNPVVGTGTWSEVSGPAGTFANGNIYNTSFTPTGGAGTYIMEWTVTNGNCSSTDQVSIEDYATPTTATVGATQNICGYTTTLSGNTPATGVGNWSLVSGPGGATIESPISPSSSVTCAEASSYVFSWTISNGVCTPSTADLTINTNVPPTAPDAGPDQEQCNVSTVSLAGNIINTGTGTWSQLSGPNTASFTNVNNPVTTATGLIAGTYLIEWTSSYNSCSASDTVQIIIDPAPTASNAGTNQSVCNYTDITLTANIPVVGTGTWTQVSGPSSALFVNANDPNTELLGTIVGTYVLRWTIINGICDSSSSTVNITINNIPSMAVAGADQYLCNSSNTSLTGNIPSSGTGTWSLLSGTDSPTITGSNPASVNGLVPGVYVFMYTIANGSCISTDSLQVINYNLPTSSDAGPAQSYCNATTFTLAGNTPVYGTGTWSLVSGPNSPSITTPGSPATTITGTIPGTYVLQWNITNGTCSASLSTVTVTNRVPIILTGPSNASICQNGTQTLNVSASGGTGSYNYQWQYFTGGIWNNLGTNTNNYSTPSLAITGNYVYKVIVTDQVLSGDGGCLTTSTPATVTVVDIPGITTQPVSPANICAGGTSDNMSIIATGGTPALNYQWQYYNGSWNNVVNGTPLGASYSGAATETFSVSGISNTGSYQYQCLVSATGNGCSTATSNTVTLNVVADPVLTVPIYTIATICAGGSTVVSSTISGGIGTPAYQWQYYNGSAWNNVVNGTPAGSTYTNANSLSMTITGTTSPGNYQYRLNTSNSSGCDYTSAGSSYTVVADPTFTSQPSTPAAICIGGTSANMNISASGGTPSLTYQWQYNNSGTWENVVNGTPAGSTYTGSNGTSFSVEGISIPGSYNYQALVEAAGNGCATATSNPVTLSVAAEPAISVQPVDPTAICIGGTANIGLTATGGTPALIYQWQYYNGTSWNNVVNGTPAGSVYTNATTSVLTVASISSAGNFQYQCLVSATGSDCNTVISGAATLTVADDPAITLQPAAITTICNGSTTSLSVTATGGAPSLNYQWQSNTTGCGGSWTSIPGATSNSYTTLALTQTTYFRVQVSATGSDCNTVTSNCATVYVPGITTQPTPANTNICVSGGSTITVATDPGGGTIDYSYQWQYNSGTWNNVADGTPLGSTYTNATTNSMTVNGITPIGTQKYQVVIQVTSPVCAPLTSNTATLTVLADPIFTSQPSSPAGICVGGTTTGMTVAATGGTPSLFYQWQYYNGTSFVNVSAGTPTGSTYTGATGTTFSVAGTTLAGNYQYQCVITASGSGCITNISNPVTVSVIAEPTITVQPATSTTICSGTTTTLSVTATGGTPSLNYQWYSNTTGCGGSWTPIAGATSSNYTTALLTQTTYYEVIVSATGSDCNPATSSCATVYVPLISTQPSASNSAICAGGSSVLTAATVVGVPAIGYTYQWQYDNSGTWANVVNGTPAGSTYANSTTASMTVSGTTATGAQSYQLVVQITNPVCTQITSNIVTITVDADPSVSTQPLSPASICTGGTSANMTIAGNGGTPSLTYQWQYYNGSSWGNVVNGTPAGSTYTGKTSTTFSVAGISNAGSYQYQCLVKAAGSGCTTATSNTVIVTVDADPTLTAPIFTNSNICIGGSTVVSSNISGGTGIPTYQWQYYNGSAWGNVVNGTPAGTTYTNATTSGMTISGTTATGTYQYRLNTSNSSNCDYTSPGASFIVSPASVGGTVTGGTTVCAGINSTGLTLSGNTGSVTKWQSSIDNWVTPVDIANTTNTLTATNLNTSTQYRAVVTSGGCASANSSATTITVNQESGNPTSATATSSTICNGQNTTLTLNGGGGGAVESIKWYTASCGGTLAGSGNNLVVNPVVTTSYYGRYEDGAPCNYNSACATITITVNQKSANPASATATSTTICNGGSTTLTLNGGGGGIGEVVTWYTASCGGTLAGTGNNIIVSPITTTKYYGRYEDGSPCSYNSACATVTITVNQKSTDPTSATASLTTICDGGNTILTLNGGGGGTGEIIHWYTGSCGGTLAGTGNNLNVNPAITTTYYGRYEDGAPCNYNSACATITITVNQKSADPASATASSTTICNGGNTVLTLNGGGGGESESIKWYTGSCGGTLAGSGNNLEVSPVVTTTYYGRYENSAPCNYNSACATITITVNQTSADPGTASASTDTICNGGTTILTLNGGGGGTGEVIQWYSGSCGGTPAGTGNNLTVSPAISTTYYGRYEDGTPCNYNSVCATITITVNQTSADPGSATASADTICNGYNTVLTLSGGGAGTGESIAWYTGSCGGTLAGTGNNLVVSPTINTTYFGRYEDGIPCNYTSACAAITIAVNQTSADPTSATSNADTICNGDNTILTLNGGGGGTGEVIKWYTGSCSGNLAGMGNNLVVGPTITTTYYGRYEDGLPCSYASACDTITITVNQISADPTSSTASSDTICTGDITILTLNGGGGGTGEVIKWYTVSCGGILVGTGNDLLVTPDTTTTYYGRYEDGSPCNYSSACARVTITVNQQSADPASIVASSATICNGSNTTLTLIGGGGGNYQTIKWYAGICGGLLSDTGRTVILSPDTTTIFYVRYEDGAQCDYASACKSIAITVDQKSADPTAATAAADTICIGGSTTLNLQGGGGGTGEIIAWYTVSCGGILVGTGNNLLVNPDTNTIYYGRYEDTTLCNYSSECKTVTITVNRLSADPTSATAGSTSICQGDTTTLTLNGGGGGADETIKWYTKSCGGILTGTGNNVAVNPDTTTTYYGRYEDGAPCKYNSACDSVTINVKQTPGIPLIDTLIQPTCTISTGSVGLVGLPATGAWTITESEESTKITGSGPTSIFSNLAANKAYTFKVTNDSSCSSLSSNNAVINAQPLTPAAPTGVSPQTFCGEANPKLSDFVVLGSDITWYMSSAGGTFIADTTVLISGLTYYAGQTIGGCESAARLAMKDSILPCITLKNISRTILENDTLQFVSNDFTSSFSDSNAYSLVSIEIMSLPENGKLLLSGSPVVISEAINIYDIGNLSFVPNNNWYGSTNFAWNAYDGKYYSISNASVNIIVIPVKHTPILISPTIIDTIPSKGGAKTINIVNNISNIDGDTLTYSIISGPDHGKASISGAGLLVYSPDSTYIGMDTITYQVCNNAIPPQCVTGEVVLNDTGYNSIMHVPVISDIVDTIVENTTLQFQSAQFTSKFTDVNNDTLVKIQIGSLPANGTLSLNSLDVTIGQEILKDNLNILFFAPLKDFTGMTSFIWTASDGIVYSSAANVNIIVTPQKVFIPEGFSPNGDGINDYFVIKGAEQFQITLQVFNRWGDKVYESKNYQNDWNGVANAGILINNNLPNGTYFYIINFNNGEKEKIGYITINR